MTIPKVEVLPIEEGATTDPLNVNKHTQRGGGLLENSLRKRGAFRSIASAGKGVKVPVVMAGNFTLEKAVSAGFTEVVNVHVTGNQIVNVVRDDIAPNSPEAIALGLEDNEIGKQSYNPDLDILAAVMADPAMQTLKAEDKILAGIVEGMGLKSKGKDAPPQIDRAGELQKKWQTASGQLWQLGKHRLLIGDCTVRENVERLMGGERADMVWIDPPYGVSYKSSNGNTIQNDELVGGDLQNFLSKSFNLFFQYSQVDAAWYIWHASKYQREFENALNENKISVLQQCIWVKGEGREGSSGVNAPAIGRADWRWLHEPCFYASAGNPFNLGDRTTTTVWTVTRDTTGRIHPTEKPIGVAEIPIKNSSTKNNIVLDGFCGSGTTIIAAQNLSRRCFAMEISEKYGAVILERFYTATGITPELEDK